MKINSNTINLEKESYEELERIIKKMASDNKIENVDSVQINLSKENGIVKFAIIDDWADYDAEGNEIRYTQDAEEKETISDSSDDSERDFNVPELVGLAGYFINRGYSADDVNDMRRDSVEYIAEHNGFDLTEKDLDEFYAHPEYYFDAVRTWRGSSGYDDYNDEMSEEDLDQLERNAVGDELVDRKQEQKRRREERD